jgi:hypothetical protein
MTAPISTDNYWLRGLTFIVSDHTLKWFGGSDLGFLEQTKSLISNVLSVALGERLRLAPPLLQTEPFTRRRGRNGEMKLVVGPFRPERSQGEIA